MLQVVESNPSRLRHELRTPLNQIIGYSEMLLEDAADPAFGSIAAELETIHSAAYGLVAQVQTLLPPSVEPIDSTSDAALIDRVRAGLSPTVIHLHETAQSLVARTETFLHPFAHHIESAARELRHFTDGAAPPLSETDASYAPHEHAGADLARLLVADDNERNREMLCHQLERQGYSVTSVSNGQDALDLLRERPFDLVLLDVLMPLMDGFAALENIKSDPALREIPVIMISASDEYSSVIRCIEGGAEDYLPKPFDPVLLRARLKASLEKKAMRDEQRHRTEELETAYNNLRKMQDQLITQEKLASLGSLSAGIAHEIKNPLNFITNFAALSVELVQELRTEVSNENCGRDALDLLNALESNARKIEEHGHRADRIVRGMLSHARKRSGDRELTDLNGLVMECVNLAYHGLRSQNMGFNASIETRFDNAVGKVNVFPQDLSRVFLNISTNAFYAVEEKRKSAGADFRPCVLVTSRALEGAVEIRFRDNGHGIPPDVQRKIFEPFFTTKPAGAGTGLGLSISRDVVVDEHHGELLVESEAGVSTEFIVRIPREVA